MLEKILPRLNPELDTDPVIRSLVFAKAFKAYSDYLEAYARLDAKIIEKYGFYTAPKGSTSVVPAHLTSWQIF